MLKSFIALLLSNLLLADNTLYLGEVYEFAEKNLLELIQEHLIKKQGCNRKKSQSSKRGSKREH